MYYSNPNSAHPIHRKPCAGNELPTQSTGYTTLTFTRSRTAESQTQHANFRLPVLVPDQSTQHLTLRLTT